MLTSAAAPRFKAGMAIGPAAALAHTRLMTTMPVGVTPADPLTCLAVAGVFLLMAVAAVSLPAWRAGGRGRRPPGPAPVDRRAWGQAY